MAKRGRYNMGRYVVVDLEMCKVPRSRRNNDYSYGTETIQIGAVLLDENYDVEGEFNEYVSPKYGYVDDFVSKLTNIKAYDLKGAPSLDKAVEDFLNWFPADAIMVAWSDSDEKQLRNECEMKGIAQERLTNILDESIDCQAMFSKKIDIDRGYKLEEAFILTDICQEGRQHDGLVDARNTAKLFKKLMTESEFKFNQIYEQAHAEEVEHLSSSLGNLLKGLKLEN